MGNSLLSRSIVLAKQKNEKQIGDEIRMKTIFFFLLGMVMFISGSRIGNIQEKAKVGKRFQNPAHMAKDIVRAKNLPGDEEFSKLTICRLAILQCIAHQGKVEEPGDLKKQLLECCRENEEICRGLDLPQCA